LFVRKGGASQKRLGNTALYALNLFADTMDTNVTMPSTTAVVPVHLPGKWPDSCCKIVNNVYLNKTICHEATLDPTTRKKYLNMKVTVLR